MTNFLHLISCRSETIFPALSFVSHFCLPHSSLFLWGALLQTFGCSLCLQSLVFFFFVKLLFFLGCVFVMGALWQPSGCSKFSCFKALSALWHIPHLICKIHLDFKLLLCFHFFSLSSRSLRPAFSRSIYSMPARQCLSASTSLQGFGHPSLSCLVQVSFWCLFFKSSIICISVSCPSSLMTNSSAVFSSQTLWFLVLWSLNLFTLSLFFLPSFPPYSPWVSFPTCRHPRTSGYQPCPSCPPCLAGWFSL